MGEKGVPFLDFFSQTLGLYNLQGANRHRNSLQKKN